MDFNSHADAIVGAATRLVNVATPGWRRGREYDLPQGQALARAVADALDRRSVRGAEVGSLLVLGRSLRTVYELVESGRTDAAARAANALLEEYRPTPYLDRHDAQPWHLHFHGSAETDPSGWGGGCSVALATVLGGDYADRLGVCGAPRCDRVFVDVSRNGRRRFCSTACQNRVKAAAHRERQGAG